MQGKYEMSDYEGATPYEFLTDFIMNCDNMEQREFMMELFDNDDIAGFEGSDIAELIIILYNMGYVSEVSAEYPRYALICFLEHEDGVNSSWKITPMSYDDGSWTDLSLFLDNPYLDVRIVSTDRIKEANRNGRLTQLLDKRWTNGEIQDLLTWVARGEKVISPNGVDEWIELSYPRYKKSGMK